MEKKINKILSFAILLSLWVAAAAQKGLPSTENKAVRFSVVNDNHLPSVSFSNLVFSQSSLHLFMEGMVLRKEIENNGMMQASIDTGFYAIDPKISHWVTNPFTGVVFYTVADENGKHILYQLSQNKKGKLVPVKVKFPHYSYTVERPCFSDDGKIMVFSSNAPGGFGGYDLWYSVWNLNGWAQPVNMGARINSAGDDIMPVIWDDFLFFSSNGRDGSRGGFDIYSSRLVALEQKGDTVMMLPVGRCNAYSLEAPFCSSADDLCFTPSSNGAKGWLVRHDTIAGDTLFSFVGRIDCVKLGGNVFGVDGSVLADAEVETYVNGKIESKVKCDGNGHYLIFLQPGKEYSVRFSAPNCFSHRETIVAKGNDKTNLYSFQQLDANLLAYDIDSLVSFPDLFLTSAGSELSAAGKRRLDVMALFLADNPHLQLNIVSAYNQNPDAPFCMLLNQSRLRSLSEYLYSKGVARETVVCSLTLPQMFQVPAVVDNGMMGTSDLSSLTVYFWFSK